MIASEDSQSLINLPESNHCELRSLFRLLAIDNLSQLGKVLVFDTRDFVDSLIKSLGIVEFFLLEILLFAVHKFGQIAGIHAHRVLNAIAILVVFASAIVILLVVWQTHAEALVHLTPTGGFLDI